MTATPTAPPTTARTSIPHPTLVPTPVCRPGAAVPVLLLATPAVPLGTAVSPAAAPTTVTAVMVLWLPFGRVVVLLLVVVCDSRFLGLEVVEEPWLLPGNSVE